MKEGRKRFSVFHSLRVKFLLVFTVLLLLSDLAVLVFFGWQAYRTNLIRAENELQVTFEQTYNYLRSVFSAAEYASDTLYQSKAVLDLIDSGGVGVDPGDEYRNWREVKSVLSMLEMGERSARIYLPDDYRYAENDESLIPLSRLPQGVDETLPRGEQAVWFPAREENGERTLSLFRRVMQRSDFLSTAAYEEIGLQAEKLEASLAEAAAVPGAMAVIYDQSGQTIISIGWESGSAYELQRAQAQQEVRLGKQRYFLRSRSISETDWIMAVCFPHPKWMPAQSMEWTTLGILLPVLLICTMVINQFSHSLLKRINGLGQQMRMVRDGFLDVPHMKSQPSDELARLEEDFFFMLDEIKELLVRQKEDGMRLRAAQLRALQAQINPHFLYNTLDLIRWEALENDATEINDIASALAEYYRSALGGGKDMSTIGEELEHITSYVKIQNLRFDGRITLRNEIAQRYLEQPIPRITLQPLVENAILHGMKSNGLNQSLTITLCVHPEADGLHLDVADNGVGIPPEKLTTLLEGSPEEGSHYAVSNVHSRLQLVFGSSYGLRYQSELGRGTIVTVLLPPEPLKK